MSRQSNGRSVFSNEKKKEKDSPSYNFGKICPNCNRVFYYYVLDDGLSCGDRWLWMRYHHQAEAPSFEETVCYQPTYRVKAPSKLPEVTKSSLVNYR